MTYAIDSGFPLNDAPRYAKQIDGASLEYVGPGTHLIADGPFELQVSLGDMDLEDCFWVSIPYRLSLITIDGLLAEVFSDDQVKRAEFLAALDVRANPDLPDMYDALVGVIDQWRRGDCTLRYFVNHGPEVELSDRVSDHIGLRLSSDPNGGVRPLLDLVIEQRHDVLDRLADRGVDTDELVRWLKGLTLLYFIDKHGFLLSVNTLDASDRRLLSIADELAEKDLIGAADETGIHAITSEGRRTLGELIEETEAYIGQYEVFGDVSYDVDAGSVEFGTGRGDDLRIQVYESEGIDPVRAVYLLRLYDSTLDHYLDSWQERIHSNEFYDEILLPVLDSRRVYDELVGWIIESGYALNEERSEAADRGIARREVRRRIRPE